MLQVWARWMLSFSAPGCWKTHIWRRSFCQVVCPRSHPCSGQAEPKQGHRGASAHPCRSRGWLPCHRSPSAAPNRSLSSQGGLGDGKPRQEQPQRWGAPGSFCHSRHKPFRNLLSQEKKKYIFNSTACHHLIKVIRSESPRNNVRRCVTAELAAALSGQPRAGWGA